MPSEKSSAVSAIKVLYIAGSGRTGSTILSLILSQQRANFNVGQARNIWSAYVKDAPCTCGKGLQSCTHWSRVFESISPENPVNYAREISELASKFRRDAAGIGARHGRKALTDMQKAHTGYLNALRDLYVSSARISKADILIDSSKVPEFALALSLIPEIELWVINLVRDPRAVAVSWGKKLGSTWKALPFCWKWRSRQRKIHNWAMHFDDRVIELAYEDFIEQPRESIRQLQEWAGSREFLKPFQDSRNVVLSWSRQHLFPPANERVLSNRDSKITIQAPSEWKQLRWIHLRSFALLLTFPLGIAFILRNRQTPYRLRGAHIGHLSGGRS